MFRYRYNLFREMMAQIRRNVIYSVYQFRPKRLDANGQPTQVHPRPRSHSYSLFYPPAVSSLDHSHSTSSP